MQIRNSSYIILNERSQKSIKASINWISQAQNRYYKKLEKSVGLEKLSDFFQSQSSRDRGRKSWRQRRIVMCEHSARYASPDMQARIARLETHS